jgi:hypothetical protein
MKLEDRRVAGYKFCTNSVAFGAPVPHYFPSDAMWTAAPLADRHWAWFPSKPVDDAAAAIFVANYRQPGELRWVARFFTGYYRLKPDESEDTAKAACADMANFFASQPQHFPNWLPPKYP